MQILIVEDFQPMALSFAEVLNAAGHSTQCVVGFRSLEPVIAVDLNGRDLPIQQGAFHLVLCDGQLDQFCVGKEIQGVDAVQRFTQLGMPCIGISSSDAINGELLQCGATVACNKVVIFLAILGQFLDPEAVVRNGTDCASRLAQFKSISSSEQSASLREQGDAILKKHM